MTVHALHGYCCAFEIRSQSVAIHALCSNNQSQKRHTVCHKQHSCALNLHTVKHAVESPAYVKPGRTLIAMT